MKKIVYLLLSSLIVLFMLIPSFAAEKMPIAVIDLKARGVSKMVSAAVTDLIRSEMVKTGLYTVVERSQMDEILKEQGFQQTGCTDQSCAVQLGKILSAKKILLGEINKMGETIMITVRIVDVEKGVSEYSANEKAHSEDVLDEAAKKLTRSLSLNIVEGNKDFFIERKTASGYYTRGLLPGLGQFYAERDLKGWIFLGSFIASAGFTMYGGFNYMQKAKDYDDVPRGSAQSEFDSKFDDKKSAATLFLTGCGITGLIYIANWVDLVFFSKPEFTEKNADNSRLFYNIAYGPSRIMPYDSVTSVEVGIRY